MSFRFYHLKKEVFKTEKYHTKQREILHRFLEERADRQSTAAEIAEALSGEHISLSAVYRNLAALEKEGKIRKISRSGSRNACYQLIGSAHCADMLHLSCKSCGKLFHAADGESEKILELLDRLDGFSLDKGNTVLYGTCKKCRENPEG